MSSNTTINIKKSGATGNVPVSLNHGEIAINYADGKIFYKDDLNSIKYINNQDSFSTINASGTLILASSPTDILNLIAGNNISLLSNSSSKSITISSTASGGGGGIGMPAYVDFGLITEAVTATIDCGDLV
jgi:hypothetical protein